MLQPFDIPLLNILMRVSDISIIARHLANINHTVAFGWKNDIIANLHFAYKPK